MLIILYFSNVLNTKKEASLCFQNDNSTTMIHRYSLNDIFDGHVSNQSCECMHNDSKIENQRIDFNSYKTQSNVVESSTILSWYDDIQNHMKSEFDLKRMMALLKYFPGDEIVVGPIQLSEAILLSGLVRTTRPKMILELGFSTGDSASILLGSCFPDCILTSVDIYPCDSIHLFRGGDSKCPFLIDHFAPNFIYWDKGQESVPLNGSYDIVFFDASHNLDTNIATWNRLQSNHAFSPNCIVIVHDTGIHIKNKNNEAFYIGDYNTPILKSNKVPEGFAHQIDEIRFVQYVTENFPVWTRVDLMSHNTWRHGISILQEQLKIHV